MPIALYLMGLALISITAVLFAGPVVRKEARLLEVREADAARTADEPEVVA